MRDFFGGMPFQAEVQVCSGISADAVVKGLLAGALYVAGHGSIIAVVVVGEYRRAIFRQVKRTVLQIVHFEGEQIGAVPQGDERAIEGIGVAVDNRLNPQSGGAAVRGGRAQNLPVECLSPEVGCEWMFPDNADGAILKCRIRQRLNPKNFGKWLIADDSDFEGEPPG